MNGPKGNSDTPAPVILAGDMVVDRRRARRESICIGIAGAIAVGAGVLGLWLFSKASIRENYRHYLMGMAQAAAVQVDPDLHRRFTRPEQRSSSAYLAAVDPLQRLATVSQDIRYIYTLVNDGEHIRYVLDAAEQSTAKRDLHAGLWDPYGAPGPTLRAALGLDGARGVPAATDVPVHERWGSVMTGYAPLFDHEGKQIGVLGVDVDASVYAARVAAASHWARLGLAPAGLLILLLSLVFYRTRVRGLAANRELTREQARVKDSEGSFRSLFELSPVGISLNELHSGRYLQVNDALVASSGYTREELLGMTYWDITPRAYSEA